MRTIDRLRNFGIPQSEKPAISLQRVVDEVRENIAALLLQSNAQIVAENLPVVTGDSVGISLIIQNLITNAIRYRSERRPVIVVEATEKDEGWIISVTDNGIGIDAKNMGRLFKPFSRWPARVR